MDFRQLYILTIGRVDECPWLVRAPHNSAGPDTLGREPQIAFHAGEWVAFLMDESNQRSAVEPDVVQEAQIDLRLPLLPLIRVCLGIRSRLTKMGDHDPQLGVPEGDAAHGLCLVGAAADSAQVKNQDQAPLLKFLPEPEKLGRVKLRVWVNAE